MGKKIALVTGASRGLGAAIALELGARGLHVAVNYKSSQEQAEKVVAQIIERGGQAQVFQADVSKPDEVTALVKGIQKDLGNIAVLVNNAGITRDQAFLLMKLPEWQEVIENNLTSLFLITKLCAKDMLRHRWGRIINISSVASFRGGRGQANYAASKGAINAFTISIARELGSRGITVNAVAPGVIATEMTERIRSIASEEILKEIVMERFGQPEDIAPLVGFLASDQAAYLTGQIIAVDGGFRL